MAEHWILALEQRPDLSVMQGNLLQVADAVRRGADLRLYMTTETYEETLYFQQTYAGEGTVFAGLMSHHHSYVHRCRQIDQPYLDALSNGLSYLINRMVGQPIFAHITLEKGERSALADLASELL